MPQADEELPEIVIVTQKYYPSQYLGGRNVWHVEVGMFPAHEEFYAITYIGYGETLLAAVVNARAGIARKWKMLWRMTKRMG